MLTWGIVATVKAPEAEVLAFVAHHLDLGASRIWIYFDDPQDPAFARIASHPRIAAMRCTDWYWALRGGRPDSIDDRQKVNARHAQRKCRLDWLAHIDGDEFLYAPRPIAEVLAEVPDDVLTLRMDALEAIHDPSLPDDILTARQFRRPLQDGREHLIPRVFGPYARLVAKGSLAHGIGKSFSRPKAPGLRLDLHLASHNGELLRPPVHPDLCVLHFHAQDPAAWRQALAFRLKHGAYRHPVERDLRAFLQSADEAALDAFYQSVMTLTPEKAALLQSNGLLLTTDLGLRRKVAALQAGRL